MKNDRKKSAVGFAMKAGRCKSGAFAAKKALTEGKARLILLDPGVSNETQKKWREGCAFLGIPLMPMEGLGLAIGKPDHMVAAITDDGFTAMLLSEREKESISKDEMIDRTE
ncbi:MAG: ribosomal L7Ae/L30e/S12e/Gadd45 family protein [Clostridia bacterium]|nr:ribosomal L7Ae/L30e/S12e/Gadd45 family protein [Clostridia bacterium]